LHTLFEQYRLNAGEWFAPHAGNFSTLAIMHTLSIAKYIPASRLQNITILGAVTALSLIHGMATIPWDPIFLHFFIHDCDISSMHPGIVGEWHPELKQTISNWLDIGPHGDITNFRDYFASYHDLQVTYYYFLSYYYLLTVSFVSTIRCLVCEIEMRLLIRHWLQACFIDRSLVQSPQITQSSKRLGKVSSSHVLMDSRFLKYVKKLSIM
jgi:hypothetical protein